MFTAPWHLDLFPKGVKRGCCGGRAELVAGDGGEGGSEEDRGRLRAHHDRKGPVKLVEDMAL